SDAPTRTAPSPAKIHAGSARRSQIADVMARAAATLCGEGRPWASTLVSRATTPRPDERACRIRRDTTSGSVMASQVRSRWPRLGAHGDPGSGCAGPLEGRFEARPAGHRGDQHAV